MGPHTSTLWQACSIQGTTCGNWWSSFHSFHHMGPGRNSGCQAWQQVPDVLSHLASLTVNFQGHFYWNKTHVTLNSPREGAQQNHTGFPEIRFQNVSANSRAVDGHYPPPPYPTPPYLPCPQEPLILFPSPQICPDTSYAWNPVLCGLCLLAPSTQHHDSMSHLWWSM